MFKVPNLTTKGLILLAQGAAIKGYKTPLTRRGLMPTGLGVRSWGDRVGNRAIQFGSARKGPARRESATGRYSFRSPCSVCEPQNRRGKTFTDRIGRLSTLSIAIATCVA